MFYGRSFFSILFIFLLFLSGCSHLNKSCSKINWYELGRQDSTRGREWKTTFSERNQFCSSKQKSNRTEAYKNGFDLGLREYCSFKTGYIYGLSKSEDYSQICPDFFKKSFTSGYEVGSYITKIQKLQSDLQKKIIYLEKKIRGHEDKKSLTMNK